MNSKFSSKLLHFRIQMQFKLEQIKFQKCNVFRAIIILYTIDLYVVLIPQSESKYNKIVSIQTMSNPKILCLPPVANTLRDLDMRFTWVILFMVAVPYLVCRYILDPGESPTGSGHCDLGFSSRKVEPRAYLYII